MATQLQFRRGNTAQTAVFTGAIAEVTVDTDKNTLIVHDGVTPGGFELARTTGGSFAGDITITGNLTVEGTTTTVNTVSIVLEDSLLKLGSNNTADAVDIGFYAPYNNKYTGLVRDSADGTYYLFYDLSSDPASNNITTGTFKNSTLGANLKTDVISFNSALGSISGDFAVTGNVEPATDNVYYLGSSSKRWHTLYVGPGSIDIGGIGLQNVNGELVVTNATNFKFGSATLPDITEISYRANTAWDTANTEITNRQANVGAAVISITNAYEANVGAARIADSAAAQANVGAGLISYKTASEANVGAGLISVTNAYEANVGAARIADSAAAQANVGAGLIAYQITSEANVGSALIVSKNYTDGANANLKNYVDEANTNLKNYVDVANTNLKNYVDTSVVGNLEANVGAGIIATQANVGAGLIANALDSQANIGAGLILVTNAYEANVGAGLISVTNAYEANVGQLRLDTTNANTSLAANIGAARIADTAAAQANVGAGLIIVTGNYEANVGAGRIADKASWEANAGAGLITVTTAYQANVGAALIDAKSYTDTANTNLKSYVDTTVVAAYQANVGAGLIANALDSQANVGAGLISVTNAYEANVGAARIADSAAAQANVGAGLISYKTASEANVGAGLISATSAYQANVGAGVIDAKSFTQTVYDSSNGKFSSSGGLISGNVEITGNLTVSGNVTTISANNLSLKDNMIYLNEGANVATADIGIAGAYVDNGYKHSGIFRDYSDGIWKIFDHYEPEVDTSPNIDTSNSSFRIGNFTANVISDVITLRGLDPLDYANTIQTASQANVGAGLISVTNAYQANVGAGRIADKASWEANTGAGLISVTSAYQANVGAGLSTKVDKTGDVMTGALTTSSTLTGSSIIANTSVTINTNAILESTTVTTAAASEFTLDSFTTSTYRSAKYLVQMTSGTEYHMIELSLIHNGAIVYLSQYGEVKTGASLGTFDASIAAGTLSLLATPTNAVTTYKAIVTLIPV